MLKIGGQKIPTKTVVLLASERVPNPYMFEAWTRNV